MNEFQARIGVGEPSRAFRLKGGPGTTKRTTIKIEEGRHAGTVGGTQTEHWSGRVDACVTPPSVVVKTTTQ